MARRPNEALRDDYDYDYDERDNDRDNNGRERNTNYININNANQDRPRRAMNKEDVYNDYDYIEDDKVSYKQRRDDGNNSSTIILAILSGIVILAIVLFLAKSPVFNQKTDVSAKQVLGDNSTKYIPNVSEDFSLDSLDNKEMGSEDAFDKEDPILEDQKDFVLKTDEDISSLKSRDNVNSRDTTSKKTSYSNQTIPAEKKVNNSSKTTDKSATNNVKKSSKNIPTTPEAPAVYENVTAYWIQVASYASLESAREVRETLIGRGFNPQIESVKTENGLVYKVKIGAFGTSEEANKFLDGVKQIEGLEKAIINNVASKKRVM